MRTDESDPETGETAADAASQQLVTETRTAPGASPAVDGCSRRIAAFFDVDNTIIRGASSFHLARGLYARGFFRKRDLVNFFFQQARYMTFGESKQQINEVRSRALLLMTGHSVAEVVAIGEEVYDQVLALRIFPGTQKLLDAHLAAGHQVWLVTATPVEIGDLIARRLGADGALGTIAEHANGFYTGRLVGDMMHGQAKADAVLALAEEHDLDLAGSSAYGDSMNDVPLLSTVGNPCAINPDPRLRKHSKTVGWPVREFRGRRRTAQRGLTTASWAGLAWAAGLVARSATRSVRARFRP
ncbi:HAD family hydrolase [Sanguibacter antarcticus]|uniref:HAD family hydrolase n=1 Tax=Sanguibacter antarcticus TaxID=372484 RepID=UPI003CCB9B7E